MSPDSTPDAATIDEIRRFEAQYARSPESLVFARLADAYRKAEMLERALEVVEDGLLRHPGYLSAHIVRARTLREMGRAEAAAAAFHRVLGLDPQNLVALRALGELARERGDADEAREWYARLAEVDPLDEQVRSALDSLEASPPEAAEPQPTAESTEAAESQPTAEGTEATESAGPEPPGGAASEAEEEQNLLTLTMAELYMRQGLYEEAERIYRQLLRFQPTDETLRQKLETVGVLVRGEEGGEGQEGRSAPAGTSEPAGEPARSGRPGLAKPGRSGGKSAPGASRTIRRELQALLEARARVPEIPRPSAFDAWADRQAGPSGS